MSLTKKDFDAIARFVSLTCKEAEEELRWADEHGTPEDVARMHTAIRYLNSVVANLGRGLAETNQRFDPDRFRNAVWSQE